MRAMVVVAIPFLSGTVLAAQSASPYVPLQHWAMPYVEHLIATGVLHDPTPLTRPLRQADLVRALEDVDTLTVGSAGRALVRRLLQEFGLEVAGVVQPQHGLTPSAGELRDMVKLLQREKIRVVFSEESFPAPLLKVLRDEAGVKVYTITHIASGAYTPEKFEQEMQKNVDTMIRALVTEG